MQYSVDTWESGLKATCDTLVTEKKTFWHLIDVNWSAGTWSYTFIAQCPRQLYVNDIHGCRQLLQRLEPYQAETTLGVDLAPNGDTTQQKMRNQAIKWADAMRTGKLSRQNTWTAISTTIWRTLSYPLSALNLTRQQCDKIMAPILKYGLPAMGICQNFPQKVVFFPVDVMGLGWTHLHTSQEIMRLEVLIKHTYLKLPQVSYIELL